MCRWVLAWVVAAVACAGGAHALAAGLGPHETSWRVECSGRYHRHTAPFERERRPVAALKPNRKQIDDVGATGYWNGLIFWPALEGNAQVRFSFVIRLEPGEGSDIWMIRELNPSLTELTKRGASAKAILGVDRRYAARARDRKREARILGALKQAASECIDLAH